MRGSLLSVNNSRTKERAEMTVRYYISSADLTQKVRHSNPKPLARGE